MVIVDINNPAQPKHAGRPDYIIATDEIGTGRCGHLHIIDVRDESNPVEIIRFKLL